jgi:ABC-type polysaccharide/polyol phosphate export permease
MFASGFALFLSAVTVFFRDVTYLWTIFIQVWFFLTPIVYANSLVEERVPNWALVLLKLNPMNAFVSTYRNFLYDATAPSMSQVAVMIVAAILSITGGWFFFLRLGRRLPEEV